jgi:hypothetical protein
VLRRRANRHHDRRHIGIFVICKQIREAPDLTLPQTYFYVMHGTPKRLLIRDRSSYLTSGIVVCMYVSMYLSTPGAVYQCPTIQHVLTARMVCIPS